MGNKKSNKFLMQGTILAAAAMISKVIGLAYRIPLTNILGDEGNGYYGVVFQVYNLVLMLTSYSLPMAVSKLVSERRAKKQYKNVQKVFNGAFKFAIAAGGIATLIVFFGAGFIGRNILKMDLSVYALRTLSPCILVVAFLGVFRGFFQGHETMIPTAVSQVLEQIVNAIVSLVGAYTLLKIGQGIADGVDKELYGAAYSAAGATLGTTLGAITALVFLCIVFFAFRKSFKAKVSKDPTQELESNRRIYKLLLLTIAPVILSATLSNITNILDQGIFSNVMAYQGYTEKEYVSLLGMMNGQYDTMFGIPLSIATALAASFMPSLVATLQTGTREEIHSKINMVSQFDMLLVIPCTVGFITLARPILDLLFFTQNNAIPAMLLRLGSISIVFLCLSTVTTAALQGLDHMMHPVKNSAIALVLHIIALLIMLFAFKWNIYAVVLSKIVFAAAICVLNQRDLNKFCGYRQEMKHSFVIPGVSAVIMGLVSMGIYYALALVIPGMIATVISLIAAVIIYAICMVAFGGLTENELRRLPKGTLLISVFKKLHLMK